MEPESTTEMPQDVATAFAWMRVMYREVIQRNLHANVVHMLTYERHIDMTRVRVLGQASFGHRRASYGAVPMDEFITSFQRIPRAPEGPPEVLEVPPESLVLAIRCLDINTIHVMIMPRSEFIEEAVHERDAVRRVEFNVTHAHGCAMCGREPTQVCSRCRVVRYCSRECQVADIANHRAPCRLFGAQQ